MDRQNKIRFGLGVSALLGLGLLFADAAPASADPPSHARAHGYRRNQSNGYNGYRYGQNYGSDRYGSSRYGSSRYGSSRYGSSSYDLDRDGIPNRRDRDIDGDHVPNRYDRNDYRFDGLGRPGRSTRWPRGMDDDRDGIRDKYDRYDHDPRRR